MGLKGEAAPLASWLVRAVMAAAVTVGAALAAPHVVLDVRAAYLLGCGVVASAAIGVGAAAPCRGGFAFLAAGLAAAALAAQAVVQAGGPWMAGLVTIALLLVCSALGGAVGGRIGHPGYLLFVAWVAGLVDVISLLHPAGVSHAVAESPSMLAWVALPFPLLGTSEIVPFLGGGDVVFVAMYLVAARTHGLDQVRTVWALACGFAAAFAAVLWTESAVPVLPFLGAAVVATHPETWRPPARERRTAILLSACLTLAVLVLLVRAA